MPRLLRLHFASIGHPDARLAPLTIDLRARDAIGTGADSVLWLRNGGGKSTILNLFYSLFRPERREFLGASAEGRARHLEDYIKADDLAFVVTEWDVEPVGQAGFFGALPARRRVVGQVLSWKDRQRSADLSKLRRRFFSFAVGPGLGLDELPVEGLGPAPVRSFDAFRQWFDQLRQDRPELEPFTEETPRRWGEHLERIGLDPELFRYQLKMNAREGSADEAFRFRTTEEFVRFYLEVALDPTEADQVASNLEGFRAKLERRPALMGEQSFLIDARAWLLPLCEVLARREEQQATLLESERIARSVLAAMARRRDAFAAEASRASEAATEATRAAREADNEAAKQGRWANGLDRRATELALVEAELEARRLDEEVEREQRAARVGTAAEARDLASRTEAEREAKARAVALARAEQEPLRREVTDAGTTLRARLAEAARAEAALADAARTRAADADDRRRRAQVRQRELSAEEATRRSEVAQLDAWLAERDRERERLRLAGTIELREDAEAALERWRALEAIARGAAEGFDLARREARARAEAAGDQEREAAGRFERLRAEVLAEDRRLAAARKERDALLARPTLLEVEGDLPDLDAPGLVDRLFASADTSHQRTLALAAEGAEDERASAALDRSGRLPAPRDVEPVVQTLQSSGVAAWSALAWLVENEPDPARRAELVTSDPALWYGVLVPDVASLARAAAMLETHATRLPVVVAPARLDRGGADGRLVLPGHPAHWDTAEGGRFAAELDGRRRRRQADAGAASSRERECRKLADAVAAWRERWGDGRLALAESDLEQRLAARDRAVADRDAARERAQLERAREQEADHARAERAAAATRAGGVAREVEVFVERFEHAVVRQRAAKDAANERIAAVVMEISTVAEAIGAEEAAWLRERELATGHARVVTELQAERDRVDLHDERAPASLDLVQARATWHALRARWEKVVSEDRLQWELEALDARLRDERARARELALGIEALVEAIPAGDGSRHRQDAEPRLEAARQGQARAQVRLEDARRAAAGVPRRREAHDLPPGSPPVTAEEARESASACRRAREAATETSRAESERASELVKAHGRAEAEAGRCEQRVRRLSDLLGDAQGQAPCELPEAVDRLVDERLDAVRRAQRDLQETQELADAHAESLRGLAGDPRHEGHRSRVKERLKAPPSELAAAAPELARDVEARLEVVRSTLTEIDEDRRIVLGELEKVATDGVRILQAAERASRLPAGLGAWENEPFLRIRAEVPGVQSERRARLEPFLDRIVAAGRVPDGRALALGGVLELASQRIEATLLKPDALLRRDRLPVVEMQTFSRGQQLTVAILLYCTLAQLRAQSRGQRGRVDSGVLLLDNPVGTCSSVPLLELQRTVARQMRVQLVYTTGVNDPDAVATFPNTVRLRNHHRGRTTGDLRVTVEPVVEAVRVVAT